MKNPTIDPGALRHRIDMETASEVADGSGGFTTSWQLVAQVWSAIEPVNNSQRGETDRLSAFIFFKITIRWRADCFPQMRFVKAGRQFLINTAHDPDETKRYLICMCEEVK